MALLRVLFGFSGRMNRTEFAIMVFGSMIAIIVGCGLAVALFREFGDAASVAVVISLGVFIVACKWAALAALAKRLHDAGASGALCLPILGFVFFLIMLFLGGTKGDNGYGSQTYFFKPRAAHAADLF
jgi:uncharacterized membrane protein YhaH (DUF805 family)